jgi:spore coat protein U-like protein
MRNLRALLVAGALLAVVGAAHAATVNGAFGVSATVDPTCYVSTNPLSFGIYHQGGGNVPATTRLSVRCTKGLAFVIALNSGATHGASMAQRLMMSGAYTLEYNLYTSPALTTVWGDGTGSSATVSGVGNGTTASDAVTETVYGALPDSAANQALPPGGTYTDTITVTVSY